MGRMTVSLSPALEEDLEALIANRKYNIRNKGEAFRNAIILYKYLLDELEEEYKLIITDQDNNIIKEIVMNKGVWNEKDDYKFIPTNG